MTKIFLLDEIGTHIGPFESREAVERFIKMMALCDDNWAARELVEGGGNDVPGQNPPPMNPCANQIKGTSKLKLVGRRP